MNFSIINSKNFIAACFLIFACLNLLSWPFVPIKYLSHLFYQFLSIGLLTLAIIASIFVKKQKAYISLHRISHHDKFIGLFLLSYFLYICFLCIASLLTENPYSVFIFLKDFLRFLIAFVFLFFIPIKWFENSIKYYAKLIVVLSIMAIILCFFLINDAIQPLGIISLPEGPFDNGERTFYGLGLSWRQPIILPSGGTFFRLQSFADEPGTFAFAATPAIIWEFYNKKIINFIIILIAILLSLSVGAIIFVGVFIFFSLLYGLFFKNKTILYIIGTTIVLLLFFYLYQITSKNEFLLDYAESKYSVGAAPGTTSFGKRYEGFKEVIDIFLEQPFGSGAGRKEINEIQADIGWLNPFLEGGAIGGVFYIFSYLVIGIIAIKALILSNKIPQKVFAVSFLSICFAALQRTPVDGSIWHWWIIVGFLRNCYLQNGEKIFFRKKYSRFFLRFNSQSVCYKKV